MSRLKPRPPEEHGEHCWFPDRMKRVRDDKDGEGGRCTHRQECLCHEEEWPHQRYQKQTASGAKAPWGSEGNVAAKAATPGKARGTLLVPRIA
jgi:hypothetical protein